MKQKMLEMVQYLTNFFCKHIFVIYISLIISRVIEILDTVLIIVFNCKKTTV